MKIPNLVPNISPNRSPNIELGTLPPCPVAPDALQGIPRQQTNPARWQGENWNEFVSTLQADNIDVIEDRGTRGIYSTDAGGLAYGMPNGVIIARDAQQISTLLRNAQRYHIPVTVRGGGLTTEGESVAFGGVLLDMTGMSRVLHIDKDTLTVRTEAGIFWHSLAEELRRHNFDYLSAPLNLTSSVGGTLGVGGIDVNSAKLGCSADQALCLQVVTPTGDIIECSDEQNAELFQRVILGYGQFGIITEATLKIRPFTPMRMHYFYYRSLRSAINDLILLDQNGVPDYSGILTMMDKAVTLLIAFDSAEREKTFFEQWHKQLHGYGELGFGIRLASYYALHPWRLNELFFLLRRKHTLFPDLQPAQHMRNGEIIDRTVVFSRAVWKHWGHKNMVIPDLATSVDKFIDAVEKGNAVCKHYFPRYTLYCVGIKLRAEHKAHYELSSIPHDAKDFSYGCEFEPILEENNYSRDYLQSFKNAIYDIGVDMDTSYYRFGGMMKAYIRRALGDEVVEKHLALKRIADPAMILNRNVIF
ncbi:MAG: FAD-binding oxidoreductase [Gammaproteobacteria bacterium]|nr:FAD-binding oxidoreductase [Gammaproteobacteria bacterium]